MPKTTPMMDEALEVCVRCDDEFDAGAMDDDGRCQECAFEVAVRRAENAMDDERDR